MIYLQCNKLNEYESTGSVRPEVALMVQR